MFEQYGFWGWTGLSNRERNQRTEDVRQCHKEKAHNASGLGLIRLGSQQYGRLIQDEPRWVCFHGVVDEEEPFDGVCGGA